MVVEQEFKGTIISVMDDGLTANVKIDPLYKDRCFAVIDDRTAGRRRLRDERGRLVQGKRFPIKELRLIANDVVITVID